MLKFWQYSLIFLGHGPNTKTFRFVFKLTSYDREGLASTFRKSFKIPGQIPDPPALFVSQYFHTNTVLLQGAAVKLVTFYNCRHSCKGHILILLFSKQINYFISMGHLNSWSENLSTWARRRQGKEPLPAACAQGRSWKR